VDDPDMARHVDAAIAAGNLPPHDLPSSRGKAFLRGKVIILSNDDDESMKYSWLNSRLSPVLRPRTLAEAGTIVVARRKQKIVFSVLAPQPGEHFAERSDFYNTYTLTLIDLQRNVVAADRTFDAKASRFMPPHEEDILAAMISWIEHLPRRSYTPPANTRIPESDTSAGRQTAHLSSGQ